MAADENWDDFRDWLNQGQGIGGEIERWSAKLNNRIEDQPNVTDVDLTTGAISSELEQHWAAWVDWLKAAPPQVVKGLEDAGWTKSSA